MLNVKYSKSCGCVFFGKGIVDRPEMGVVSECREVVFDEFDVMRQEWKGREVVKIVYKTDNGYSFDDDDIRGSNARLKIDNYAPSWRAKKGDCWS